MAISPLIGVPNFRDFGGHRTRYDGRVRPGRLFRSGVLPELDRQDERILSGLGIRLVADLRSHRECRKIPTDWSRDPAVEVVHLDVDLDLGAHNEHLVQLLRQDPTERGAHLLMVAAYTQMPQAFAVHLPVFLSKLIAADASPALIHCAAGKDRTGFLSALILLALDVPVEDVIEDYLATSTLIDRQDLESSARAAVTRVLGHPPLPGVVSTLLGVRKEYLEAGLHKLLECHGSVANYFHSAGGLDSSGMSKLRDLLID